MPSRAPSPSQIERFRRDLETLTGGEPPATLGVAVSGGPDSLALLLLANAALPERVRAATVDHRLRPEGAEEARFVGGLCSEIGVPHATLTVEQLPSEGASIQARARVMRYFLLGEWLASFEGEWLATGHHLDDQAETMLMRLNRASGTSGLAGIRASRRLESGRDNVRIVRPLLGWRRAELAAIVREAGIEAIDDPSNRSPEHDRTHVRCLLAESPLLDPERLALSASNLAEAEEALAWAAEREWVERHEWNGEVLNLRVEDLPPELVRRLVSRAIDTLRRETGAEGEWRQDKLARMIEELAGGGSATLAGIKAGGGAIWRFEPAPPRRRPADRH